MKKFLNFNILLIIYVNSILIYSTPVLGRINKSDELALLLDSQVKTVSTLVDQKVHDFINNVQNSSLLLSEKGKRLISQHNKRLRLRAIRKGFEKCKFENDFQNQLAKNLTLISSQLDIKSFDPCQFKKFKTVEEFTENAHEILSKMMSPSSVDYKYIDKLASSWEKINTKSIHNLIKSYVSHLFDYDKDFLNDFDKKNEKERQGLINSEANRVVKEFMSYGEMSKIKSFSSDLKKNVIQEINEIVINRKKKFLSVDEIKKSFNQKSKELNVALQEVSKHLKSDEGYFNTLFWDSSDQIVTDEAKLALKMYHHKIESFASKSPGSLIFTNAISQKIGNVRVISETEPDKYMLELKEKSSLGIRAFNPTTFKMLPHKEVDRDQITSAIDEVKERLKKNMQTELARRIHYGKSYSAYFKRHPLGNRGKYQHVPDSNFVQQMKSAMEKSVLNNPVAAAEVLFRNPELIEHFCEAIRKIDWNKSTRDSQMKTWTYGSAVVGGALLISGVGVVFGLLSGAVASFVGTSGLVFGAIEGTVYGKEALIKHREYEQFLDRYYSENAQNISADETMVIEDAQKSLGEYEEAVFNLSLAIGFTAIDLGILGKIYSLTAKGAVKVKDVLKKSAAFINLLIKNKTATKNLKLTIDLLGSNGKNKLTKYLQIVGSLSEESKLKILDSLKDKKFSPLKLKEHIDETLNVFNKSCKI